MIPIRIVMNAEAPDSFAAPSEQQRIIDAIEALVQAEGFDDTDTVFNETGQGVTPSGTRIYLLEEGGIRVGKNEMVVESTITANGGDPAAIGAASRHGANFVRFSKLREDGVEELLAMILVRPDESMNHLGAQNLYSHMGFWRRIPSLDPGNDDRQFELAAWIDRFGIHFNATIFLHGMQVFGALAAALPPGFALADEYDDTADRELLRRILARRDARGR